MSRFKYTKEETLLKSENVSLYIGKTPILRDINVEIKNIVREDISTQGQIVGFLGPSGVGKTQFSEILTGLKTPGVHKESNYEVTGRVMINTPGVEIQPGMVGFVQQNYPLFDYLNVYKNLKIAAKKSNLQKGEQEDKIKFYLEKLNLIPHALKYPAELSGGTRQRVAIAQQLLCSKHFLVLDEPFSGLDVHMIDKVCIMLQEVANMNELNTIIVISHDIAATVSISDTLWIMGKEKNEQGEFVQGSKILFEIDLLSRGLAWEPEITQKTEFGETIREIRSIFPNLL